jgi:DNA invertase Pin-like site-specific DNA recombinase
LSASASFGRSDRLPLSTSVNWPTSFQSPPLRWSRTAFTVHILAAVAEHEAKMISERTKAALAAAKARGVKLGGDRGAVLTAKARQAGCKAVQARADARAADLAPTIADIQASGARSLWAIAAELNRRGIQTPRGVGEWKAGSVAQLLARL